MVDRTQEDVIQDQRIANLEQKFRSLETKTETMLNLSGSHTTMLGEHERRLDFLDPLKVLLEHLEPLLGLIRRIK